MIHPTAIIDPTAQVDPTVVVGPYAVIDAHVVIGPDCTVGPFVHLTGHTTIGVGNRFHTGAVIGNAPQDLKYRGDPTRLRIGDGNTFREHVTVNRATYPDTETVIGSHNLLMACVHVGHDCHVGNRSVLANGVLLGGHVVIGDRVLLSGNCLVHQFVRVGTLAMMQGGSGISLDLPPYTVARDNNTMCGLNTIGLRRAGLTSLQRLELRRLYHRLFRGSRPWRQVLEAARAEFTGEHAGVLLDFLAGTQRGICADARRRSPAEETAAD